MGKYLNSDYEEVEAYSPEELAAKIKEATASFEKQIKEKDAEIQKVSAELADKDEKLTKRSEEYKNLKKAFDEKETVINTAEADRKAAFEKMRDSMIAKAAGDDKEYAEKLKEQFERIGKETLDPVELEASLKDAHALALNAMNRDFTTFSLNNSTSGEPPVVKKDGEGVDFAETEQGKASLEMAMRATGMKTAAPASDDGSFNVDSISK